MLKKIKKTLRLNSMFVRLFTGFIVIIIFISSFHLLTVMLYMKNMESEITENVDARLYNTVNELENKFYKLKNDIFMSIFAEFYFDLKGIYVSPYTYKLIEDKITSFKLNENYICELFIIIKTPEKLLMPSDMLFNIFYKNDNYSKNFWLEEMNRNFTFKFYTAEYFNDISIYAFQSQRYLMPVAFKHNANSKFIMVAMIDVKKLLSSTISGFTEDLYLFTKEDQLLFPQPADTGLLDNLTEGNDKYIKLDNGYLFIRGGVLNEIIYCKFYSNILVKQQLKKIAALIQIIIISSILISGLIALYIVRKLNNPVKQIVQLIKKHESNHGTEISADFKYIASNIKSIIEKNSIYEKDISKKDSLLKSFSYQVKMLDIFVDSSNAIDELSSTADFIVVYFKAHYKETFYEHIFESKGKGTFFLKGLIETYINSYFSNSVTFQTGNDQIVSIVNIENDNGNIFEHIERILNRLETEEDFVFFTVACSGIYRTSSDLKNAYGKVKNIAEHRKLYCISQFLTEDDVDSGRNSFYFTKEQQEQFMNSVQNGQMSESTKLISEILDFNYKKEVNNFYVRLLCNKIVNSCTTVFMELYNSIPKNIKLADVYSSFSQCTTIEDYKELCLNFVSGCINYINIYKNESDYIIDYVKNYVSKHYNEDIFLDLLSGNLNISKTYLSSYFKDKTGTNFVDYLNTYRIKKATKLLGESPIKVKNIASKVGIPNLRTFNRLFRKYVGQSPNEYRHSLGLV